MADWVHLPAVLAGTLLVGTVVVDITVNPPQSPLLMQAANQGCPTINGLGMLVQQAAMTFQIWTGFEADVGLMHEALEEFLEL